MKIAEEPNISRINPTQNREISMREKRSFSPEVSIALCTYNGELFLREQLDSILNQDYPVLTEIVCVDDNSTDNSWSILQEYAEKFTHINISRNTPKLGYVKNFEKELTLTTKPFIAISDQDDIWYPTKITKLVSAIGNNLMVYSDSEYIDINGKSSGNKLSDNRNLTTCTSCLNFALFNAISGHNILMSKDLLKYALPFSEEIPHDFWLGFHASQLGEIPVVKEVLVGYRQHANNIIGGIGHSGGKKDSDLERIRNSKIKIDIFAKNTALYLSKEQKIFEQLAKSYTDKSFAMRLKRVCIFWKNNDALFLFKKRTKMRNLLYCL